MDEFLSSAFGALSLLGGGGLIAGFIAWRKYGPEIRQLKAETHRTVVETALAEDAADVEAVRVMIATQTQFVLEPIKAEVERQGRKLKEQDDRINELEGQVK